MAPPSLTTLPDEVQQLIYRHVYPITDITLLPDTDPDFHPKDLTSEFNIIGNHGYSLLQTCSKVCAIAKPVRDSSFTGRVNVSRVKDLVHCGFWIAHNVKTICLIPIDLSPVFTPHLTLFPKLRTVIIADTDQIPPLHVEATATTNSIIARCTYDKRYIEMAKLLRVKYFSPNIPLHSTSGRQAPNGRHVLTIDQPKLIANVAIYVYVRMLLDDVPICSNKTTLGFTVRLLGSEEVVVARAIRDHQSFTYWQLEDPIVQDPGEHSSSNHGAKSHNTDDAESHNNMGHVLSSLKVTTTPLDRVPDSLAWVKHDDAKIEFHDLF